MLNRDPDKRPTAKQLMEFMKSKGMNGEYLKLKEKRSDTQKFVFSPTEKSIFCTKFSDDPDPSKGRTMVLIKEKKVERKQFHWIESWMAG